VLDANCQLKNLLAQYASTAQASGDRAADAAAQGTHSSSSSSTTDSSSEVLPAVNMLLLSDSVDRYVLQHVCDYLHGVKHTIRAREEHMQPAAPEAAAPDSDAAQQETAAVTDAGEGPTTAAAGEGPASVVAAEQQAVAGSNSETAAEGSSSVVTGDSSSPAAVAGAADSREPQSASQQAAASPGGGPSSLNATAYAFHTCELPGSVPLKLASSYFPGVHPIGPFHRGLTQNYSARISAAAAMWEEYAGAGQPPHVVGVASALWDVARLWKHERQQLDGQELSRPLLDSWVANFSGVVHYAKTQVPQVRTTQLWVGCRACSVQHWACLLQHGRCSSPR
jgi:hypothetical protein